MKGIEIKDQFYLDGEPFKLISGAIHYFRIVPEYWQDRLEKLRAMGCNTVETYIPWNMHEPKKGSFTFDGMLDIKAFIKLAQEIGLYVVLRPSPYICAEWELGGLPAWLLKEDGMRFRCTYAPYQKAVKEYYDVLMPYLKPLMYDNGGPVIMMQVENEYGYYGDDKEYLDWMKELIRSYDIRVPLFTSDGPFPDAFPLGKVDGLLQTGNFGSRAQERFDFMKQYVDGPLACMEFWLGWFDNWGCGEHHTTSAQENTKDFAYMLDHGNVNIYMFIGGTNFGFMNGSNYYDELTPDVTSYDYDAILTEDGQITEKYTSFQKEIEKRFGLPDVTLHSNITRKAYGSFDKKGYVSLWDSLGKIGTKHSSKYPVSMEKLDQSYGYILYHTSLERIQGIGEVRLFDANDRAKIYVNKKELTTLYDRELLSPYKVDPILMTPDKDDEMDILVENMGRVNFGPFMARQRKGIDGPVTINTHQHFGYDIYTLPLDNIDSIEFKEAKTGKAEPGFHKFEVEIDEAADTFINMEGWGKGCVFLNGFNLGRFWEIGPQMALYIPAPLLKKGRNEIVIFETEGKSQDHIVLEDKPNLGPVKK